VLAAAAAAVVTAAQMEQADQHRWLQQVPEVPGLVLQVERKHLVQDVHQVVEGVLQLRQPQWAQHVEQVPGALLW
jgi:hypothetical protein